MPQNTNLNISPYFDDFDKDKNFYRVLFRPGFPIQARELTTMQSILQNQIEAMGQHLFKEGAMVIPGQIGYDRYVDCVVVQQSFLGVDVETYREQLTGRIIEGLSTGIKAKVLYSIPAVESSRGYITLYIKYLESGDTTSSSDIKKFQNNEQLISENEITFGNTLIETGSPFAQLLPVNAVAIGSTAYMNEGVYFIRGHFVDVPSSYIILDQYTSTPSYRVGFEISESIITPEDDPSLNDNAIGSSNYTAPGGHRLRIKTTLVKKPLNDETDANFIELLRINNAKVEQFVNRTEYNEIERANATRTYETNGDYVVRQFEIRAREHLNDFFNNGVYSPGTVSRDGSVASEDLAVLEVGPGVGYVKGYRSEIIASTYVDAPKTRTFIGKQNQIVPVELSQSIEIYDIWGWPRISGEGVSNCYQIIELRDDWSGAGPTSSAFGNIIGKARTLQLEVDGQRYRLYMFDVQMFTAINFASSQTLSAGEVIVGRQSGARGFVYAASGDNALLSEVTGEFQNGEVVERDGRVLDVVNAVWKYDQSDTRSLVGRASPTDNTVVFTASVALTKAEAIPGVTITVDQAGQQVLSGFGTRFSSSLRPGEVVTTTSTDFKGSNSVRVRSIDAANIGYSISNRKTSGTSVIFDFSEQTAALDISKTKGTVPDGEYPSAQCVRLRPVFSKKTTKNGELAIDLPRDAIKSISDESVVVFKTFANKQITSGDVTFTLPENEQFTSLDGENYILTITQGSNTNTGYGWTPGTNIDIEFESEKLNPTISVSFGANRQSLQVSGLNDGSGGSANISQVTLTAAVSINSVSKKIKTAAKMRTMKVVRTRNQTDVTNYGLAYGNLYGTRIEDEEISFALNDVYKVHAVYESNNDDDAQIPYVILTENVFFDNGSVVVGRVSGARARVVSFNSNSLRLYIVPLSSEFFNLGETIDGVDDADNKLVAVIDDADGSINKGSRNITSNFDLDTNQNDFFYGVSTLVRKKNTPEPRRKLAVVFDFFIHEASGDYFSNQSYSGIRYSEIPRTIGNNNTRHLSDTLDFRPAVGELASGSGTVEQPYFTNCISLDFDSRVFTSTGGAGGSTIFNIPKVEEEIRLDYEYYLPRRDKLFMTHTGLLNLVTGVPAEEPTLPENIDNAMLLATVTYRPYVYNVDTDIYIELHQQRRYTMEDIGQIEARLRTIEYYTTLSLLESDALNLKAYDDDGFDRLKNGFLVDDFSDHSSSAVNNIDYKSSIDIVNGICRPSHFTTNVALEINEVESTNINKLPVNILTLPYEEITVINQPYASRTENVNPFNVFTFIGRVDLVPTSDDWTDTTRAPARVINIEGDFEATRLRLNANNQGFAPIQWNAWQTTWSGTRTESRNWWWGGSVTQTTTTRQARTGLRTRVVSRIDTQSMGDRIISSSFVPWIRSRNIGFTAVRLKPKTRMFAFFDGDKISQYITPKLIELVKNSSEDPRTNETPFIIGETVVGTTSGARLRVVAPNDGTDSNPYSQTNENLPESYASQTNILNVDIDAMARTVSADFFGNVRVGEILLGQTSGARAIVKDRRLITNRIGTVQGTFFIPNPQNDSNPRWATGTRVFRLTALEDDSRVLGTVDSSGEAQYQARGIMNTLQENILAVRNAELVRDTVSDNRVITSVRSWSWAWNWGDPLAQSFQFEDETGVFVTSVDIFFATRDTNIPISMHIRTMENGYPTKSVLPFSDVTLTPGQVEVSDNASIPTRFTFAAPVYLQPKLEYCFVLFSDSNEYRVWISRMGDIDITGTRTISDQPYAGVLFKSQNASTWSPDQYEDLKFVLRRATFDTSVTARAVFNNAKLGLANQGILSLINNPITTIKPKQQLTLPTGNTYNFTVGARIIQTPSNAQATILEFDATANPQTLLITDIVGTFAQGFIDGQGNPFQSLKSSQSTVTLVMSTVNNGDFAPGDVITGSSSGATAIVTNYDNSTQTITANYVDSSFDTANDTITEPGGVSGTISSAVYNGDSFTAYPTLTPQARVTDKKIHVFHPNHGMHSRSNNVEIKGVESEIPPTILTSTLSSTATSISVQDASAFHKIINGANINATNPGYLKIIPAEYIRDNTAIPGSDSSTEAYNNWDAPHEIIAYSAINATGNTITVATSGRGMSGTAPREWPAGSQVQCYNLDGIPLIEVNKVHTQLDDPTLDSYTLNTNSVATVGIRSGGAGITATQNVPFETITPTVHAIDYPETDIAVTVNTTSGTSIGNSSTITDQASFINNGSYDEVQLGQSNVFDNPRIICSQVNEDNKLEGRKSFSMRVDYSSDDERLSPIIDLDRISLVTTSNRINRWPGGAQVLGLQSELDVTTDVSLLPSGDQNEAIHLTRVVRLANISRSIRVYYSVRRFGDANVAVYYRIQKPGDEKPIEQNGYTLIATPDVGSTATIGSEEYEDYEFSVDGLEFTAFQVKLVMTSSNQANVPIIKDLRCIAFAT